VLSGHAHLYQRFTRLYANGKQAPYVVCGAGGFAVTAPMGKLPPAPFTSGDYTLEIDPLIEFGYLTVTTDAKTLTITFKTSTSSTTPPVEKDSVTVDLQKGVVLAGHGAVKPHGGAGKHPGYKPKKKGKG